VIICIFDANLIDSNGRQQFGGSISFEAGLLKIDPSVDPKRIPFGQIPVKDHRVLYVRLHIQQPRTQ
jgi:hypothetical protein